MRRVTATLLVVVLSLAAFPASADAYFWTWIDDLSGPRFAGLLVEVEVRCEVKNAAQAEKALEVLHARIAADLTAYKKENLAAYPDPAKPYLTRAVDYATKALAHLKEARLAYTQGDKEKGNRYALEAVALKEHAVAQFAWAQRLKKKILDDPFRRPGEYVPTDLAKATGLAEATDLTKADYWEQAIPIGLNFSTCRYQPLERNWRFLRLNAGVALDIKDDHQYGKNWMFTFGSTYHWVVQPWVSYGLGGGVATFRPSDRSSFPKIYLQPVVVDIRPGSWVKNADLRSPWRQFVYVRYGILTFPQGFEAGRFTRTSPAYPKWELVHTLGVHFDLAPIIRARRSGW